VSDGRIDGGTVLERLHELPGGPQLIELAAGRQDVELIGGAARDLLLGREPRELDVVVDGEAEAFAARIASILDSRSAVDDAERCVLVAHERFGTALVSWPGGRIDVAGRRAESYRAPGALPDVRPGTPEEDLLRRDFTINAIALGLGGAQRGELRAVPHALEDLSDGRLRVLHERSFLDDPTRLLRLARYGARLGFEPEPLTAQLVSRAIEGGALSTISRARFGAELRLALAEPDPPGALQALQQIGALAALEPALRFEPASARRALSMLPADGRPAVLLLACLLPALATAPAGPETVTQPEPAMRELLDDLEFSAGERDAAVRSAIAARLLIERLDRAGTPSQLAEAAGGETLEAVALAAALAEADGRRAAADAARRWLSELRHVRLTITGDDLLGAGIAAGPEVGRRLALALRRKLDGELDEGREAELSAALEGS
jgi:tRNA nucleotidyltransferase (CCA-adding enzyme)